jgi:hypothetical protein
MSPVREIPCSAALATPDIESEAARRGNEAVEERLVVVPVGVATRASPSGPAAASACQWAVGMAGEPTPLPPGRAGSGSVWPSGLPQVERNHYAFGRRPKKRNITRNSHSFTERNRP